MSTPSLEPISIVLPSNCVAVLIRTVCAHDVLISCGDRADKLSVEPCANYSLLDHSPHVQGPDYFLIGIGPHAHRSVVPHGHKLVLKSKYAPEMSNRWVRCDLTDEDSMILREPHFQCQTYAFLVKSHERSFCRLKVT